MASFPELLLRRSENLTTGVWFYVRGVAKATVSKYSASAPRENFQVMHEKRGLPRFAESAQDAA